MQAPSLENAMVQIPGSNLNLALADHDYGIPLQLDFSCPWKWGSSRTVLLTISPKKWSSPQPGAQSPGSCFSLPLSGQLSQVSLSHRASITPSAFTSLCWFPVGEASTSCLYPAFLGSPQRSLYLLDPGLFSDTHFVNIYSHSGACLSFSQQCFFKSPSFYF